MNALQKIHEDKYESCADLFALDDYDEHDASGWTAAEDDIFSTPVCAQPACELPS